MDSITCNNKHLLCPLIVQSFEAPLRVAIPLAVHCNLFSFVQLLYSYWIFSCLFIANETFQFDWKGVFCRYNTILVRIKEKQIHIKASTTIISKHKNSLFWQKPLSNKFSLFYVCVGDSAAFTCWRRDAACYIRAGSLTFSYKVRSNWKLVVVIFFIYAIAFKTPVNNFSSSRIENRTSWFIFLWTEFKY